MPHRLFSWQMPGGVAMSEQMLQNYTEAYSGYKTT